MRVLKTKHIDKQQIKQEKFLRYMNDNLKVNISTVRKVVKSEYDYLDEELTKAEELRQFGRVVELKSQLFKLKNKRG